MPIYKNLGGDSGVSSYIYGENYIDVTFSTGAVYRYSYIRPGKDAVEHMKMLADRGEGLNEYIGRSIRNNFEVKLK